MKQKILIRESIAEHKVKRQKPNPNNQIMFNSQIQSIKNNKNSGTVGRNLVDVKFKKSDAFTFNKKVGISPGPELYSSSTIARTVGQ